MGALMNSEEYENPVYLGRAKASMLSLLKRNDELRKYIKENEIIEFSASEIDAIGTKYIEESIVREETPTPAGLAVVLGTNSAVLMQCLKENSERGNVVRNLMEKINAMYQQGVVESRVPVKAYEIIAKNYMGLTDTSKQEIVLKDDRADEREISKHIEQLMSRRELLLDNDEKE